MISKLLFNITVVFFFSSYISATLATPAAQPAELQKINENIHDRSMRRPIGTYVCRYPYIWQRRECMPLVGSRAYQDVCSYSSITTGFRVLYQNVQSACPENMWCTNIVDEDNTRLVRCVAMKPGKRRREGPQVGASERKRARPTLGLDNTQLDFSVKVEDDLAGASVGAVLESDDGDYIIAPNNVIVGKIHGKEVEVCKGDQSDVNKARECYPNGTYNLKKGDIIDYTWGMTNDQEGILLYSIIPSTKS